MSEGGMETLRYASEVRVEASLYPQRGEDRGKAGGGGGPGPGPKAAPAPPPGGPAATPDLPAHSAASGRPPVLLERER